MSATKLVIAGEMTIYRAAELKALLLDAVDGQPQVDVDLSQVSEIDTAGVQLLMLAKQAAERCGRAFRLHSHSPAVLEVFELLNVVSFFGDLVVISESNFEAR